MYNANSHVSTTRSLSLSIKPLAAAMLVLAVAGQAHATVNGGTVAAGTAIINANGATTTINQSSDRAIINWNSFDIGANEKVQINQPSSTSAILNRVHSNAGTRIDGELNANGQVFVVNPNGVVVGATGKTNASGVVLSTLDVSDTNFMQNASNGTMLNFRRLASAPEAAVVNDGTINAMDGGISLIGTQVINSKSGVLQAESTQTNENWGSGGPTVLSVNLIAADSADMSWNAKYSYPNEPAKFPGLSLGNISGGNTGAIGSLPDTSNLVANDGVIVVAGGQAYLQAVQADNAEGARNTGLISTSGFPSYYAATYNRYAAVKIGSGEGVYVGGSINAAGAVRIDANRAPLIVDGSIFTKSYIELVSGLKKNDTFINAGATVYSGDYIVIGSYDNFAQPNLPFLGSVFIDGNVTAMSYFNIVGDTISVKGGVGGYRNVSGNKYNHFTGNNVALRDGSIFGVAYQVTEGKTTNNFDPQQSFSQGSGTEGNDQISDALDNAESPNTKAASAMEAATVDTNGVAMVELADSASIRVNNGVQVPVGGAPTAGNSSKLLEPGKASVASSATHNNMREASKKVRYVRPVVTTYNAYGSDQAGLDP